LKIVIATVTAPKVGKNIYINIIKKKTITGRTQIPLTGKRWRSRHTHEINLMENSVLAEPFFLSLLSLSLSPLAHFLFQLNATIFH